MSETELDELAEDDTEATGAVLSDAEGEEAEEDAETPEDDPEANGGQETASAPQGETLEELEAKRAKLARSATTWRNRVSDVLGEEAQYLVPCELCETEIPGFHFPADVMRPADELQTRLVEVLRGSGSPDLEAASDVRQCDICHGYGKTVTGSRVPGQETKVCAACLGFGYVPPPGSADNGRVDTTTPVLSVVGSGDGPVIEDNDVWGSPRVLPDGQLNPNYGRMVQYKDPNLP